MRPRSIDRRPAASTAVIGHVKVEVAIVVVVEEGPAGGPARTVDSSRRADVRERPIAVIEIEDVRP